ncbi:AAA family ATPase [Larkinella terrae]|uniref:AAA family ATPase n=1 Tax=Larkinella terrae TaxID=2025311 RepID=A0A7K0EJ59_9BACT|nr:AAA family ATPase [Larkinella terrae]MRS61900.1 AAA family ATPase [Larkinella terrae]
MILSITNDYLSLKPFESDKLTDFVVITGTNGSGKTQLLKAILEDNLKLPEFRVVKFSENIESILKYDFIDFDKRNYSFKNWSDYNSIIIRDWHVLKGKFKDFIHKIYYTNIPIKEIIENNYLDLFPEKQTDEVKKYINELISFSFFPGSVKGKVISNEIALQELNKYLNQKRHLFEFIFKISRYNGLDESNISTEDFINLPYEETLYLYDTNYTNNFLQIFASYIYRRDLNRTNFTNKVLYGEENNSISDIEFIKANRSPFNQFNDFLNEYEFKFRLKDFNFKEFEKNGNFSISLTNSISGEVLEFQNLSSGERILFSFYALLFLNINFNESSKFPDLILLDEPDAFLHPDGIQTLIQSLYDTVVNKNKSKVFITTHNPTTIALSPEDSIYQLSNENNSALKKVNKDRALEILINTIPILSINYRKHKQIIVESPTDLVYYQIINEVVSRTCKPETKLYFISGDYGDSSCEKVINLVNEFRGAGNKTVYGIIDWDKKNYEALDSYIFIHGDSSRYSLENFLFDPIYIFCSFIEKDTYNVVSEFDLGTISPYLIGNESEKALQSFSDYILKLIYNSFPYFKSKDSDRKEVYYANGKIILLPKWFLEMGNHQLDGIIKKSFPIYNSPHYKETGKLQKHMSKVIGRCFPFIPTDSYDLMRSFLFE